MAPEQLEGKSVDARADVFAFGAVLYEMLTAKTAFDGGSTAAVMASVLNTEPSFARSADHCLPDSSASFANASRRTPTIAGRPFATLPTN